jgi:transcriptional regulator GlxA family with amidase domain
MPRQRPTTISILATKDTSPSTLYGLYDVLSSVGVAWENFVTGKPGDPKFEVNIVATGREPFRCGHDVLVSPHHSVEENRLSDILLIASFVVPSLASPKGNDERELDWLSRQQDRGATIASACTGAIMLAESGLLNGWEATTHWAFRDLFRIYYPDVQLRLELDLCVSGSDNQIITSGGATSWQAMALYLIARFCSVQDAANTAKFWRIPLQEESQAAFAVMPQGITHDDAVVNDCQRWIAEHYSIANPINGMVQQSGLPPTTFARRFKRATGYRPIDYVHTLRIDKAREMLEINDEAVDHIGREVGYEDPASFRRIFKRMIGMTPSIYRRKFSHSRFQRYGLLQ